MGYFDQFQPTKYAPSTKKTASPVVQPKAIVQPKPVSTPQLNYNVPKPAAIKAPSYSPPPQQPVQSSNKGLFKGSIFNKALDLLRLPEYAFASFDKGLVNETNIQRQAGVKNVGQRFKAGFSNIIPGVKSRTGFGTGENDFNLGGALKVKNPLAQNTINILSTFGAPTIPIGKIAGAVGKVTSKVPTAANFVSKTVKGITNLAKETPAIYKTIEGINPYFRNPEAGKIIEKAEDVGRSRVNDLYKIIKQTSQNLTPEQQRAVGLGLEGKSLSSDSTVKKVIEIIRPIIRQVGEEAQATGQLTQETLEKFKNGYLPHTFLETIQPEKSVLSFFRRKAPSVAASSFKARAKDKEGYIQEYAPAVFKRIGEEIQAVEAAKGYKQIAQRFGRATKNLAENTDDFVSSMTIKDEKIRSIIGRDISLPKEVIDYINRIQKIDSPEGLSKVLSGALQAWKAGKTIYNPAYHIRNLISNQFLSDMSTGKGLPSTIFNYGRAVKTYFGKGDKFAKAAEKAGLIKNVNQYESTKEFLRSAQLVKQSGLRSIASKVINAPRKFQTATEETSKLNVFKSWIQKIADKVGKSVDEVLNDPALVKQAVSKAEEAIFSPYRIGSAERSAIANAIPFYSFTRQALPFTVKTALNNPSRIAKYGRAKDVVENLSADDVNVSEDQLPEQYQDQIRLPLKNEKGEYTYLDPQYLYPFGNFGDFGGERGKLPFGLGINPFFAELIAQLWNYDPFLGRPVTDSNIPSVRRKERLGHLFNSQAPAFAVNAKNKLLPAFKEQPDYAGRIRGKAQAVIDTLFGIKTTKANPQTLKEKTERGKVNELRSIRKEENDILSDPTLSEVEKARRIRELRGIYQNSQ